MNGECIGWISKYVTLVSASGIVCGFPRNSCLSEDMWYFFNSLDDTEPWRLTFRVLESSKCGGMLLSSSKMQKQKVMVDVET